jgi:hypothetical protein
VAKPAGTESEVSVRVLIAAVVSGFICLVPAGPSVTVAGDTHGTTFYGASFPHTITITIKRHGAVLSVLEIPSSVHLSIEGKREGGAGLPSLESFLSYHGNVVIRTRLTAEVEESESRNMEEIMARAPLTLILDDVDVVVESSAFEVGR